MATKAAEVAYFRTGANTSELKYRFRRIKDRDGDFFAASATMFGDKPQPVPALDRDGDYADPAMTDDLARRVIKGVRNSGPVRKGWLVEVPQSALAQETKAAQKVEADRAERLSANVVVRDGASGGRMGGNETKAEGAVVAHGGAPAAAGDDNSFAKAALGLPPAADKHDAQQVRVIPGAFTPPSQEDEEGVPVEEDAPGALVKQKGLNDGEESPEQEYPQTTDSDAADKASAAAVLTGEYGVKPKMLQTDAGNLSVKKIREMGESVGVRFPNLG